MVLLALAWAGASAAESAAQTAPPPVVVGGACEEAQYKTLAATPISTMGDREHAYFLDLDGKCRAHKRALAGAIAGSAEYDACVHPPYVALLAAKPPADMTKREYAYFVPVDRECAAFRQAGGAPPAPQLEKPSPARQFLMGFTVLGSIIATLVASLN